MSKKAKNKKNITVLMGGRTPEHEISLISGREVVRNLDEKKYEVVPLVISREGDSWIKVEKDRLLDLPDPLNIRGTDKEYLHGVKTVDFGLNNLLKNKPDLVFIAMHGPFGEDGTVQGMLEFFDIKYTGPGVLSSSVGMNKILFKNLLMQNNLPVPKFIMAEDDTVNHSYKSVLGNYPYVVKPHNQGSSIGISLVKDKESLGNGINEAKKYSKRVIIEEWIGGLEVTCGVIGNNNPKALPLVEIHPKKAEFFDYESKYSKNGAVEIVPARISKKLTKEVQQLAIETYKLLECKNFSRVDFILKDKREPYILEINTIPGFTPMSLLPKAAECAGYSYGPFLDEIVKLALQRF